MFSTISSIATSPCAPPIEPRSASVTSLTSAPISVATRITSSKDGVVDPPSSAPAESRGRLVSPGRISMYLSPSMPRLVTWATAPSCSRTWGSSDRVSTASDPSSEIASTLPIRTPAMRTAALRSRPATDGKRALTVKRSPRSPTGMSSILMMNTPRMIIPMIMNRPIRAAGVISRPPRPRAPFHRGMPVRTSSPTSQTAPVRRPRESGHAVASRSGPRSGRRDSCRG